MSSSSSEPATRDGGGAADLVSVIIPCYNHADFLGEAIESVLGQSYRQFEIIVVDDGSTDNTSEVARHYSSLKYLSQQNAGPSSARNAGLHQSRGEYVVFLDADDHLLPHALQVGIDRLTEHPECAFVSGHCRVIDARGAVVASPQQRRVEREHNLQLLRGGTYIWCPATVLYRRAVFDFVHGFDPAQRVEDYDLYLRITRDFAVHCHGAVIAEYRQHKATRSREVAVVQHAALRVHAAQWDWVKANKRLREAYNIGQRFWREEFPLQQIVTRVRDIVRERLPADAIVAVATGGNPELLRLDGRRTWHFPQRQRARELFAEGPEGSAPTGPWIEAGITYEFTLEGVGENAKPLAHLLVRGVPQSNATPSSESRNNALRPKNGVALIANPNPVPVSDGPGSTTITWTTGDGSPARIYIWSVGEDAGPDPLNSEEANNYVEAARVHGAQYLLLPANSFYWLDHYAEFRSQMEMRYPVVVREEDTCVIFDLRQSQAESTTSHRPPGERLNHATRPTQMT